MQHHWLFFGNVAAHWVALMSGIASVIVATYENIREKPILARWFWVVALVCLAGACDGAWRDEHRNSEVLIGEKLALSAENGSLKAKLDERQREVDWLRDHRPDVIIQKPTGQLSPPTISYLVRGILGASGVNKANVFVTAHGNIEHPSFQVECESECALIDGQNIGGSTKFEAGGERFALKVHGTFVVPAMMKDGDQVVLQVQSKNGNPVNIKHVKLIQTPMESPR